ncbi:hypothetical protein M9Y10_007252 [Tritrichomonas musculus]|uniref:Uncharacterized protein n=1 Tax=Tritrichomonas musculus TaxID=1915356 RepID=A0ABR2J237_9EUKA
MKTLPERTRNRRIEPPRKMVHGHYFLEEEAPFCGYYIKHLHCRILKTVFFNEINNDLSNVNLDYDVDYMIHGKGLPMEVIYARSGIDP